jgi:nitroreductase
MEFSKLLEQRRSYRSLVPVSIDQSLIDQLTNAVKLTPSCYNKQPWRFLFIYDKDVLNKAFTVLSEGNAWAKKASLIIAVLSQKDFDCMLPDGRNYYKFDTGMATSILLLKATELGLVAHPIAGYKPGLIKEIFNISETMEVLALIVVGKKSVKINAELKDYQIESEKKRPERKENSEFIYINKYK